MGIMTSYPQYQRRVATVLEDCLQEKSERIAALLVHSLPVISLMEQGFKSKDSVQRTGWRIAKMLHPEFKEPSHAHKQKHGTHCEGCSQRQ